MIETGEGGEVCFGYCGGGMGGVWAGGKAREAVAGVGKCRSTQLNYIYVDMSIKNRPGGFVGGGCWWRGGRGGAGWWGAGG
jgi:hypothetical protein